jgi:hypothetical protein
MNSVDVFEYATVPLALSDAFADVTKSTLSPRINDAPETDVFEMVSLIESRFVFEIMPDAMGVVIDAGSSAVDSLNVFADVRVLVNGLSTMTTVELTLLILLMLLLAFSPTRMKLPDVYSDARVEFAAVLTANKIVGRILAVA